MLSEGKQLNSSGWSKPCFRLWSEPSIHNRARLHFWRDPAGHEVDFILEEAGKLVALEIKAVRLVTRGDLIGIRAFRDALKHKGSPVRGVVLHSGKSRPLGADAIGLSWR